MQYLTSEASSTGEQSALITAAVRGALNVEASESGTTIRRLPGWTRGQYGDAWTIDTVSSILSGVRLEFETTASWIELEMTFTRPALNTIGRPPEPAVVSLTLDDGTEQSLSFEEGNILQLSPEYLPKLVSGGRSIARFELPAIAERRRVTIWLPHRCSAELHQVRSDSELIPARTDAARWIHYGSSISQASEADTPTGVWPVVAARQLGLDLLNLGLAAEAHLDQFVARTIRDEAAALITLKLGINVINRATYTARTFTPTVHGFLDTIREGHATTPIVIISPISCPGHENAPGPTIFDKDGIAQGSPVSDNPTNIQLTLSDIRRALSAVFESRAANDANLYFLDGNSLFGPGDTEHLPDGLHPDTTGYRLMGERFAAIARQGQWLPEVGLPFATRESPIND